MKTGLSCILTLFVCFANTRGMAADAATPASRVPDYKIDERGAGELATTTDKLQVLAAPRKGSKVLDEYDKGAMMAVLGEATGTGYLYVSPCNACENGFVLKTEFQSKTTR